MRFPLVVLRVDPADPDWVGAAGAAVERLLGPA